MRQQMIRRGSRATVAVTVLAFCAPAWSGFPTPVLRYTFDEGSGPALDSGTPPHTPGDLLGGAVRSTDTPAGFSPFAVDFTNDNPYAHVLSTDADDLDGLGQFTLTTWLKVNQYTAGNNRLSAKQSGTANFDGFSWNMNATPNSGTVGPDNFRLGLFVGGSGGFAAVFSDDDVGAVEWTFLAATYNSITGEIKFFRGDVGSPVTQVGSTLAANVGIVDGLTARYGVGFTDAAPAANTSVIGLQDDVRVYNVALELQTLDFIRLENIPEPTSSALAGAILGLLAIRRRRRR